MQHSTQVRSYIVQVFRKYRECFHSTCIKYWKKWKCFKRLLLLVCLKLLSIA